MRVTSNCGYFERRNVRMCGRSVGSRNSIQGELSAVMALLFAKAVQGWCSSSSSGTELPLMVESYGLLNDIFPFTSILDAGYPIFNLHLANVLFDAVLPSVLGSSL